MIKSRAHSSFGHISINHNNISTQMKPSLRSHNKKQFVSISEMNDVYKSKPKDKSDSPTGISGIESI